MSFLKRKYVIWAFVLPLLLMVMVLMFVKLGQWRYWEIMPERVEGDLVEIARPSAEPTLTGSYLAGYVAQRRNLVTDAANYYSQAFYSDEKNPNPIVFESAYKSQLLAGEVKEAVAKAKKFYEQNQESVSSVILIINDLIKHGKYKEAEQLLKKELLVDEVDQSLSSVDMLIMPYISAWMKVGSGNPDDALNYMEENYSRYKVFFLFTNYQRAMMLDFSGKNEAAYDAYKKAIGELSLSYHVVLHFGNLLARMEKWDEALALYQTYDEQNPQNDVFKHLMNDVEAKVKPEKLVHSVAYGVSEVMLEAARMLIRSGYAIEGLAYAQLSLYLDPHHMQASLLVAQSLEMLESYASANKFYHNIPEKSPLHRRAVMAIAKNNYLMGNKKEAFSMLEELAEANPDNNQIQLALADIYRQDEQFERSAEYYEKAIKQLEAADKVTWRSYFAAGIAHERAGNWDVAEAYLQKALALAPERPEILNYLGYSWIDRNLHVEEGKEMIAKALVYAKNDPHIMDSMGWAFYLQGDYKQAVTYLEKAAEELPYDSVINDHLGDTYWQLGRKNEARFQWKRVLEYPDDSADVDLNNIKRKLERGLEQ